MYTSPQKTQHNFFLVIKLLCFSSACFSIAACEVKNLWSFQLFFSRLKFIFYFKFIYLQQETKAHLIAMSEWVRLMCWLRVIFLDSPKKNFVQNWHFSAFAFKLVEISPLWHSSKCASSPFGASIYFLHSRHLINFFSGCFQIKCRYMALRVPCICPHSKHLKFFFLAVHRCIWKSVSFFNFTSQGLILFPRM
jgi:hypothetical protein